MVVSLLLPLLLLSSTVDARNPFRAMFPSMNVSSPVWAVEDVGEPLFLTPYLEAGRVKEAQEASLVRLPEAPHVMSHAGFMTVNAQFDSNMFFWFFPAAYQAAKAPVVIWLQGGPGGSSLFGVFVEHGPFSVTEELGLVDRTTSWSLAHNVIYLDNPVGTGFSFTQDGFAENETAVAEDLFACVTQIFTLFPDLQDNELYVTGESYAGKYVPALSYRIHQANIDLKASMRKINFKGMAIGDGLCDPATMTEYGDFLHGVGLLDSNQRDKFKVQSDLVKDFIAKKDWIKAFEAFDNLLNGDLTGLPSFFTNTTGFHYYFNYLETEEPKDMGYYPAYLELATTRRALHVGNLTYNSGEQVEKHLLSDVMQSVKPWIEELIAAGYKVLLYNGQLDVIIAHPLTQAFIDSLQWPGKAAFDAAPRTQWRVGSQLAGYVKTAGNFSQVLVRNAGHMVPYDQPKWAYDLFTRFTNGKIFY